MSLSACLHVLRKYLRVEIQGKWSVPLDERKETAPFHLEWIFEVSLLKSYQEHFETDMDRTTHQSLSRSMIYECNTNSNYSLTHKWEMGTRGKFSPKWDVVRQILRDHRRGDSGRCSQFKCSKISISDIYLFQFPILLLTSICWQSWQQKILIAS